MDLFESLSQEQAQKDAPLASFMRPDTLDDFVGQHHLVGDGKPLRLLMENKQTISMIFWGPPGVGKTTLARLFAQNCDAAIFELSAVTSGVADLRKVIEKAKGLLMSHRGMSEEQAYQALRKMAMDRNQRLAEVAQNVITVMELLG